MHLQTKTIVGRNFFCSFFFLERISPKNTGKPFRMLNKTTDDGLLDFWIQNVWFLVMDNKIVNIYSPKQNCQHGVSLSSGNFTCVF